MAVKLRRYQMLLVLFVLAGLLSKWRFYSNVEHRLTEPMQCADLVSGCKHGMLELKFDRTPQILRPFTVTLKVADAKAVYADFAMQGMEMGLNRYRFKEQSSGIWQADVILPICVQGRSDWVMRVELEKSGAKLRYQMQFQANP